MQLQDSIRFLKGVGGTTAELYQKLGISTIEDLIEYLPRKYIDYSQITKIANLRPGLVTIEGTFDNVKTWYSKRGLHITTAQCIDDTGHVMVQWFNQPFRQKQISSGHFFVSGEFDLKNGRLCISNPTVELKSNFPLHSARIVPIYPETKGLTSNNIRKVTAQIQPVIAQLNETLPISILDQNSLLTLPEAYNKLHFPKNQQDIDEARLRIGFEEIFRLSLAAYLNKQEIAHEQSLSIAFDAKIAKQFVSHLPFKLTDGQRIVIWQIFQDMQKTVPMNRLIEGDVGSGKTVIASMAGLMAMHADKQVVFLAPTEILANQHYATLSNFFNNTPYIDQIKLLIGKHSPKQKNEVKQALKAHQIKLLIGTHAILSEDVDFHNLGLIIIDEQHRFGVNQRRQLQAKTGHVPHVLSLSATPIPRSLALTLYGELDITQLQTIPSGRLPIITKLYSSSDKKQLYRDIAKQIDEGRQAYFVCPMIEESQTIKTADVNTLYKSLQKIYPKYNIALLHGKLKGQQKSDIMEEFVAGKIQILVSTTVIEVGVHNDNATVMVIEGADRFGLAQLHQLRGRVGRGTKQSYCYLVPSESDSNQDRLRLLEHNTDGFKLAELDLKIRGPGSLFGLKQSGALDLSVANFTDTELIAKAQQAAQEFVDSGQKLSDFPHLAQKIDKIRSITYLN